MTALVWTGIGLFLAALLTISWWYDRDARRRGATPLSGGQIARARRGVLETARQENAVFSKGATPRAVDAARDIWEGRTGPDGSGR